jgi:hypothetical protein
VLDGGDKDVFLGGSRLNKFMETVEAAAAAIPESMLEDAEEALVTPVEPEAQSAATRRGRPERGRAVELPAAVAAAAEECELVEAETTAPAADPWSGLLQVGMALLQQMAGASRGGGAAGQPTAGGLGRSLVMRDEQTGETYLKVPVPKPEVLDQALKAVGALLESLRQ